MASLNLSSDGPAINRSYKFLVDGSLPTGSAASSPTYGQWAVYSVSAPLANAFQADSGKESTLRVQSTGEGELVDLIDEFSDGRIQFAFLKIKDQNTSLPKSVLIAWCGEGVPERTKGYFGSHLSAVSKLLHGYHVQITARSDRDLTPESIIRKVADASGSKYSGDTASSASEDRAPPPPAASKPAFTPTQVGGSSTGFKSLGGRSRGAPAQDSNTDEDGWAADAPRTTRTQLEKVAPAYKPTKVNMAELTSQKPEPSRFESSKNDSSASGDVVRGGYQPIGKVDIAAIRRQAQESGNDRDDRPAPVKGSYEPVGKVDIAAIRARAQPSGGSESAPPPVSSSRTGGSSGAVDDDAPKSLADRSAAFTQSERISTLPKPKVANRFGAQASQFTGTKAPAPGGFGSSLAPGTPVGAASKNFADQGGKTPAQLWAERKARERGTSGASETTRPAAPASPMQSQASGEMQSGYGGKKWGAVSTGRTAAPAASDAAEHRPEGRSIDDDEDDQAPSGGISSIRDRFKDAAPMGRPSAPASRGFEDDAEEEEEEQAPPPPPMASRPNIGGPGRVAMPGIAKQTSAQDEEDEDEEQVPAEETSHLPPPPRQARSPTPPTPPVDRDASPIRIAMPTARGNAPKIEAPEERFSAPPMPLQSLARVLPDEDDLEDDHVAHGSGRAAGIAAAEASMGAQAVARANPGAATSGKRALVQFDYEKAEDNELELKEGEYVTNIEMVDEDWWMGENPHGERGLFPSNYVELVEEDEQEAAAPPPPASVARPTPAAPAAAPAVSKGPTAIAEFDYEAAEDNELSFPEGATITGLEFPDDDWWSGSYGGKTGLFPANYVKLEE